MKDKTENRNSNTVDRRSSPRYYLTCEASYIADGNKSKTFSAKILNISDTGILIESEESVSYEGPMSVTFVAPISLKPIQVMARALWSKPEKNGKTLIGVGITGHFDTGEDLKRLVAAAMLLSEKKERRADGTFYESPLQNRKTDYENLWNRSPYYSFFSALKESALKEPIDTLVISKSISYLAKKIRKIVGELPRIVIADAIDGTLRGNILVVMNLECRRRHETFTFLDFDEYRLKNSGLSEPLKTLHMLAPNLYAGTNVRFLSIGPIINNKLVEKYLHVSRFEDVLITDLHHVTAKKRALFNGITNDKKFLLTEIESRNDIDAFHSFSERFYSAGRNYLKEIDDLFTPASHFYIVKNQSTGETITCARITWHLPNQYLPCMLASKENGEQHIQLKDPDNISYAEIYAPYFSSVSALKAYGELVKRFIYYTEHNFVDVYLTTYDAEKEAESRFLKKYLGFKQTDVILNYGDFGGRWRLIHLNQKNLDKNVEINFSSPENSPRFINNYRNR